MPNITIHLMLASRALGACRSAAADAPFAIGDAVSVNAFLHGAVAPDMGYFPSADRRFSMLAHRGPTAELARRLVESAATQQQRAFAWGWVTHVLADAAIHPLIDVAAAELREREGRGRGALAHPDTAHMRVEYGLDALFFHRNPEIGRLRLRPALDDGGAEHLAAAFRRTHGVEFEVSMLLSAHRASARLYPIALALNRVWTGRLTRPLRTLNRRGSSLLKALLGILPPRSPRSHLLCALLQPAQPPAWLVARVDEIATGFGAEFIRHATSGLAELENRDLMSGDPQSAEIGSRVSARLRGSGFGATLGSEAP